MSTRKSALYDHHIALGAHPGGEPLTGLDAWCDMDVAFSYASDPCDEHDAVREAAGLFDVSALKKVIVSGLDALSVVDHVITRDMTKIYPGKSAYGPILTEEGTICDDAIIANLGDHWMVVHGGGETMERLIESSTGKDVTIEMNDDLHDVSLQGPKSVQFLNEYTPFDLYSLEYFHLQKTTLFGHEVTISRTGYSGERGYEIFANSKEIVNIWENILELGQTQGIVPCSFGCLDKIRVEAALLFYPYDMSTNTTPSEVGLNWAVSQNGAYRGKEAARTKRGSETIVFAGIQVDHNKALAGEEEIYLNGTKIGVVNSPVFSHRMNASLALIHIDPAFNQPGTQVEIRGTNGFLTTATISNTPFYDADKMRTHS